jgi:hypothetical protein
MKVAAGLYAVAHSFNAVDKGDLATPNTLIGHYTPHFHSPNDTRPTLFLVDVEAFRSPILGIPDVYFGVKPPRRKRHHLFLIRRKAEWPRAWDSLINRCHHDEDVDDTVFETDYEKLVEILPGGTEGYVVKTPEDAAAELAAEKAAKVAAKKKKEKDAAEKKAAKIAAAAAKETDDTVADLTAAQTAPQQLVGLLKRKRAAPRQRSKR